MSPNTNHTNHEQSCHIFTLPDTGFVRLSTILKVLPISKTTWWNGIKAGRFPPGVKLSANVTAWRARDIHKLIASYNKQGA
ncbi:MAG: AlpA family phage regulatory protein [Pseudomonadota bacterium]